jgi:exodeoxyribonuclease-3
VAGMKGHFHFAQKKGYSRRRPVQPPRKPSAIICGFGDAEFDAEGATWRRVSTAVDEGLPRLSVVSCYFPSGSSGEHRQAANSASWH